VANLCLVDLYWGRRGYTAVEGDVLSYLWDRRKKKSKGPLAALNKMVTITGEFNTDHFKFNIISGSGKKMEK
jgi:hypothetical protein